MQNSVNGMPSISLAGHGHLLITLWVNLISKYLHQGS